MSDPLAPAVAAATEFDDCFPAKCSAYAFDGRGDFASKPWDLLNNRHTLSENTHHSDIDSNINTDTDGGSDFSWYHIELPRSNSSRLSVSAQCLIGLLCPPLKLRDILALVSNGPFCSHVDGALIFRISPAGSSTSVYRQRLAVRVTDRSVISVSLGRIPRLGFAPAPGGGSLLEEVPSITREGLRQNGGSGISSGDHSFILEEHVLEFLLTMNHSDEADNSVPVNISSLVMHIIDTHIDHLQDIVTKLEMNLDEAEHDLDNGGAVLKQQMLEDRLFPKMRLDLQRLLQVIAQGEQVFPRLKEKCSGKTWLIADDLLALEVLVGRLHKLKENVGFLSSRITALQTGLDSWQSEQINRKLYYLSFLSIIFLPLSVITAVFGMNVGGVPWTNQRDPTLKHGFRNVLLLCGAIIGLLLSCFCAAPLFRYVITWKLRQAVKKKWLNTKRSIIRRGSQRERLQKRAYTRL